MALALLAAAAGLAKGVANRVEKRREENQELVKSRLQLAAINKRKREEELNARKAAVADRYSSIAPYLTGEETPEEKLALVSNETITKDFIKRRSNNEALDLKQYLVINKEKIPTSYKTVQEYINTISAPPTALTEEQMRSAFGRQEGPFGANVGVSAGRAERIARGLGGGSAAELLAYEQMQPVSAEPLADIARLNVEQYGESFDSIEDAVKKAEMRAAEAEQRFGADDKRTDAAKQRLAFFQSKYEAPVKSLESRAQTLASQIFDEQDPQKKAAMEDRLKSIYSAISAHKSAVEGDKEKSVASIDSSVRRYVNTRMQESLGASWMKFTRPKEIQLPDGSTYTVLSMKEEMPVEEQQKMFADQRRFARQALVENGYMGADGKPLYNSVREVMNNLGITGSMPKPASAAATPPAATRSAAPQAASAQPVADRNTRTRAQIQAVVDGINKERKEKGINPTTYEEIKRAAEAEGIRVIEK
jgi:hypothetical protein